VSIAITDDHQTLADVAAEVLTKRDALGAARALLEAEHEPMPDLWAEIVELGWLGLHLPERFGGSGYGFEELAVVVEQCGRHLAPGPFVPTVIASAVIDAVADDDTKTRWLPNLASGDVTAGVALAGEVTVADGRATGELPAVLGAGLANLLVARAGDDAFVAEVGQGVAVEVPANLDPTRRSGRVRLDDAAVTVFPGGARALVDLARTILSAEAAGITGAVTEQAAGYARERLQFGRVIGTFQAVKHHCANMAVASEELVAAVWDAARAASMGGDQLTYAAAVAAAFAGPAAYECTNLNTQVHGGIGFTWEHNAHMYLRRAVVLQSLLDSETAAADLVELMRRGVRRERSIELPPEAEVLRDDLRAFIASIVDEPPEEQRRFLIDAGYLMPHWPRPWGRDANALEQLVIEEEFAKTDINRSIDPITRYEILTLIAEATPEQVARWVPAAMKLEQTWCQLFSEPDAGSDAAGIKTRGTRTDGGWLLNGQKVWTSGAQSAAYGLATVRTNPDVPKHAGITVMVVDMKAPGIEIRPLRQPNGSAHFNEIFFTDVFVPDEDVIGEVDGGWKVARATLGNESISVGANDSNQILPPQMIVDMLDAHPERVPGGDTRVGRWIGRQQTLADLNLRRAARALAGGEPGPEGSITKLVFTAEQHETAALIGMFAGPDQVLLDGPGLTAGMLQLSHRVWAIGGGTSEIKRNQVGERILGLPRDPLIN
jgi:alkylation response protein AidB-like acyl-CoA dehydrogenase